MDVLEILSEKIILSVHDFLWPSPCVGRGPLAASSRPAKGAGGIRNRRPGRLCGEAGTPVSHNGTLLEFLQIITLHGLVKCHT